MKESLNWHKKNIVNWERSLEIAKAEVEAKQARCESDRQQLEFYKSQVAEAERTGRDSFDSDKFLVKKNKRGNQ